MIRSLKFDAHLILTDFLADALASRVSARPDAILALPLHPARLRERGFNQSHLLAARIARTLRLPLLAQGALRIRDTPPQSAQPLKVRARNVHQAFALSPMLDVKDRHFAIVDDVMTTGASIDALARLLRAAGAKEVSAWVVARTPSHRRKP